MIEPKEAPETLDMETMVAFIHDMLPEDGSYLDMDLGLKPLLIPAITNVKQLAKKLSQLKHPYLDVVLELSNGEPRYKIARKPVDPPKGAKET